MLIKSTTGQRRKTLSLPVWIAKAFHQHNAILKTTKPIWGASGKSRNSPWVWLAVVRVKRPLRLTSRYNQRNFRPVSALSFAVVLQATWEFMLVWAIVIKALLPTIHLTATDTIYFQVQMSKVFRTEEPQDCSGLIYGPSLDSLSLSFPWQNRPQCRQLSQPLIHTEHDKY